jgi:N-acyl-D-amino-acid deacylase
MTMEKALRQRSLGFLLAGALVAPLLSCAGADANPGTVIVNARVIDGSGGVSRQVGVRIEADRIVAVGDVKPGDADEVVDAGGLALAPGFIDPHSHHDIGLLDTPQALAVVSQGATTIVVGQDGDQQHPLADFFARLEESPAAINVASYAGHGVIRGLVMGEDYERPSTPDELQQMKALLRTEMEAGALGLGTGLEYDPGRFSTPEEVLALAKVAAEYGGRYISHFRSEDQYFWEALDEIINIGREARLPVQVAHLKLAMQRWWGQNDRLIHRLDTARAEGIEITADIYPYTMWNSDFSWLLTLFPDGDPERAEGANYILGDMLTAEGILLGTFPAHPEYAGMNVAEVAELRGADTASTLMDLLKMDVAFTEQGGEGSSMLGFAMVEPDIEAIMAWPHSSVCSDGDLAGAHPRGFGTYPRFLGRYVREQQVVSLEEGVRKITALAAEQVGLTERGRIEPGFYADLVLFDPATVIDRSTPEEPHLPSVGIERVWVNGQTVYERGMTTSNRPGMPIRRTAAVVE